MFELYPLLPERLWTKLDKTMSTITHTQDYLSRSEDKCSHLTATVRIGKQISGAQNTRPYHLADLFARDEEERRR